jgi:NADPH2:quinone reductase
VSSADKAEHARAAGADLVVNYRTEDVAGRVKAYTAGHGVEHIVDVDFGGNLASFWPLIALNGSIAYYATNGNPSPTFPAAEAMRRNISIHAVLLNSVPEAARRRAQADTVQCLRAGAMVHTVSSVYALDECARAHAAVEAGDKRGTVVVDCTRSS